MARTSPHMRRFPGAFHRSDFCDSRSSRTGNPVNPVGVDGAEPTLRVGEADAGVVRADVEACPLEMTTARHMH